MELIKDLEKRFQNLDAKLNTKVELASKIYSDDLERVHLLFSSNTENYENGLNECRGEMLRQLIQKRNEQLEQTNGFQISQQNNLTQFKSLHKSIKSNYARFSRGLASVYESILFRSKLADPLKFVQLVKYSKLMQTEQIVDLAKANISVFFDFIYCYLIRYLYI